MTGKFVLSLVVWLTCVAGRGTTAEPEIPIEKGIVFGNGGDVELKLDLARPTKGDGPFPLVVCIHGGAWRLGNRTAHHRTIRLLASHGYVAATVQYRLTPKYRFPAQIEDVKCAVRFLRANARKYNIDPEHVAALGDSAGGHLSLLLGLMDPRDGMEGKGGSAGQSSKVQAVVNYYGPTDLSTWAPTPMGDQMLKFGTGKDGNGLLADFVGTADRKDPVMKTVSPLTYVDSKDAAVLTFHGTVDQLVPLEQAKVLHAALKKAGVPERLEVLEGAGHGWGGAQRERTDRVTVEFLDKYLKMKK
jgi:acetyl esterase/lipase